MARACAVPHAARAGIGLLLLFAGLAALLAFAL
jgi:hypothetical protein